MNNENGFDVNFEELLKYCEFDRLGDGWSLSSDVLILAQCFSPESLVSKIGLLVSWLIKDAYLWPRAQVGISGGFVY